MWRHEARVPARDCSWRAAKSVRGLLGEIVARAPGRPQIVPGRFSVPIRRDRRVLVFAAVALLVVLLGPLTPSGASPTNTRVGDLSRFRVPGAFPWGTAFDQSGRVWVAMPGCDPDTGCPSSTLPGKLGLFNPATGTWDEIVQLPSGYGQP